MDGYRLRNVAIAISLVTAIVALCRFDWMLAGVEFLFIIAVTYPCRKTQECFSRGFLKIACVTSVALLIVSLLYATGEFNQYHLEGLRWIFIIECLIRFVLVFDLGFMFSLILDKYTQSQFSKRWLIVFALVFTFAVSAMDMFTVGFGIWYTDGAFFNSRGGNTGHLTDHILMIAPTCAIISGVPCALVAKRLTRGVDKSTYFVEVDE